MLRAEISALSSQTDLTEADLQAALAERDRYQADGDELGYAHCLLVLAHLVKWVRSDNDEPPFFRSHTLAVEAMAIMRQHNDREGLIEALLDAAPMGAPEEKEKMLEEAMAIATELNDERQIAKVLNRQAAHIGMSDRKRAVALNRRALEIFERIGHVHGQALCLFSLTIAEENKEEKLAMALKCAELYRSFGRLKEAAKATCLVLLYWPEGRDLEEKREIAEKGLDDAQHAGGVSMEGVFYQRLTEIHAQLGNLEEAEKYRRWARELEQSDGLTDEERRQNEIEFTKLMVQAAKAMGNAEGAKMFREQLKELKRKKVEN